METFRGYRIKGKRGLSHWAALLEEWLLCTERYCRILPGVDAPYIYNERANLSVLSGAAWRAGWIALEEFQHDKEHMEKGYHRGRGDLWLYGEKSQAIVEAKFRWTAMDPGNTCRRVQGAMNSAVEDAEASKKIMELNGVGIGFFPLYTEPSPDKDIDCRIEKTIEKFLNFDYHAMAWCFPPEMRKFRDEETGNVLPGVILLAKNSDYYA